MAEQPGDKLNGWDRVRQMNVNRRTLRRRVRRAENATVRHARKFLFRRWNNAREVQRHIITWIVMIGVLLGATGFQLLWYQHQYETTAAAQGGTYAEAVLGPVNTLNPLFASSSAEESVARLMFSSLLTYDTSGHLSDDLATNITISPSKTTYTVSLRPDATWSDGQPVTANDVTYTVGLLENASLRTSLSGWGGIAAKSLDAHTVQFTLPAVYAAFEQALTFPILPSHLLKNVDPLQLRENSFSNSPVGSGPFKLSFVQTIDANNGQEVIHLDRNPTYYGGQTNLDRFQLYVYDSPDDIIHALSSSEVNAATDLPLTLLHQVNTRTYGVAINPIDAGLYAILNTTSPVLKDKAIRQALQVGTNTTAIRNALGEPVPELDLPFVQGQLSGNVPAAPVYNQAAALKLLSDDGWVLPAGGSIRVKNGQPLKLTIVATKDSDYDLALEQLVGQWRTLGIDITTQIVDPSDPTQGVVQNILQPRAFDVLLYPLQIGADPDVYAYWHSSQANPNGFNFADYANSISDEALTTARSRLEPDLRNAKYITFAKQWLSDVPAIGLYQLTSQYIYNKNTTTLLPGQKLVSATDRYDDILDWSVGTRTVYKTP